MFPMDKKTRKKFLGTQNVEFGLLKLWNIFPMTCVCLLIAYGSWYTVCVHLIRDSPEPNFMGKIYNYPRPFQALWFLYWMSTTYFFLIKACLRNPGFLPEWLKEPLVDGKFSPQNLLRIYNMRTWMANGIYSFEKYTTVEGQNANLSLTK